MIKTEKSVITITNCPVCHSNDLKEVFDGVDYFSSGEVFPVCDCTRCGFRFTNNFPSEDSISGYYDSPDYISHSDSNKGLINRLYHYFRKRMLKKKVDLAISHTAGNPIRLLDIGCGTGYFLQAAQERGLIVSGIEKDKITREKATIRSGVAVKDEKSFMETAKNSFDVVTLWHVLEHIEKLNETIDKIEEIIAPEGTVILALPNCRSYDARFYKKSWAAYDIPRHLWHFSPDTVEKLLNRHHFTIVKKVRMPLDAFYISLLSEKYRKSAPFTQYIRAFWVGTAGFLRSLSNPAQSSSIIYIAKKK